MENTFRGGRDAEDQPGMTELDVEDYGGDDADASGTPGGDGGYGDRTDNDVTARTDSGIGARKAAADAGDVAADQGKFTGGDAGQQTNTGQFGEFGETGVGTDLTMEMENTDARTGLVKGGQQGASNEAGPGQYGGETGSVSQT